VGVHQRIEEHTFVQSIRIMGGETMDVERDGVSLYHVAQPVIATPGRTVVSAAAPAAVAGADSAAVKRPANAARGAVVSGRVTPEHDTVGIAGIEVELVGSGMRASTDAKGRFRFAGVAEGSYDLRVRSVGYLPWVVPLSLLDGRLYDSDVRLQHLPNVLTEVRIEGHQVQVPFRFQEVYRRGALGFGKFITREEIERQNSPDTKSLFQQIPGVLVNDRGITFERCKGLAASSFSPSASSPAHVQVYIDGVRMTGLSPGDDAEHALRIVPPTAIQAIEVYTGVAQIPAEFLEDACAVIAIWTKSY
jgi:hypothetical protein